MGRIIFATRDTGEYERFGHDLRGMTDMMANALCRNEISDFSEEQFWAPIMGCRPDMVRMSKEYFFSGSSNQKITLPDGKKISAANVATNQLKLIACEELKLLIHIHLQCELHAWVSEEDRVWFAATLERAMEKKLIYRDQKLLDFLTQTARGPIVLSYSVCDEFPDLYELKQKLFDEAGVPEDEEDGADVHDVAERLGWTPEKIWDECFAALAEKRLQLTPKRIEKSFFDERLTLFDVIALWRDHNAKMAPKDEPGNTLLRALIEKQQK